MMLIIKQGQTVSTGVKTYLFENMSLKYFLFCFFSQVVQSCIACLAAIVNKVTHNHKLVKDCFQRYFGMYSILPGLPKEGGNLPRALNLLGAPNFKIEQGLIKSR